MTAKWSTSYLKTNEQRYNACRSVEEETERVGGWPAWASTPERCHRVGTGMACRSQERSGGRHREKMGTRQPGDDRGVFVTQERRR